jgi:hypothetical protein
VPHGYWAASISPRKLLDNDLKLRLSGNFPIPHITTEPPRVARRTRGRRDVGSDWKTTILIIV